MAEAREVDAETMDDIVHYEQKGLEFLGIGADMPPAEIVRVITERVRELKAENRSLDKDDTLALGCLLGRQYIRGFGWHWAEVVWDFNEEDSAIGVLPQDNSLFINPMWWMSDTLETRTSTNFMLNYNMVAANNIPAAQPDEAVGFH
ncbi:MAG: hypothetical protein LBE24_09800 [Methylobacillus sp.]|jgi:hypothetical protein|nr:hypothetical protein [Methylobacillus sp.]